MDFTTNNSKTKCTKSPKTMNYIYDITANKNDSIIWMNKFLEKSIIIQIFQHGGCSRSNLPGLIGLRSHVGYKILQ